MPSTKLPTYKISNYRSMHNNIRGWLPSEKKSSTVQYELANPQYLYKKQGISKQVTTFLEKLEGERGEVQYILKQWGLMAEGRSTPVATRDRPRQIDNAEAHQRARQRHRCHESSDWRNLSDCFSQRSRLDARSRPDCLQVR